MDVKLFDSMWIPLQFAHISCFKLLILTFSKGHPKVPTLKFPYF